jgi:hypothetical protein
MSLLDVVDQLVGATPTSEERSSPGPAFQTPLQGGVQLRIVVEAVDAQGGFAKTSHVAEVQKGTIKMMEMLSEGDVLHQLATSAMAAAVKSVTPQPGNRGGGQVLEAAASKPGPVGGRTPGKKDPLAEMLGLEIIEHQNNLDRVAQPRQAPQLPQPQPQPMGGPHTHGPRPLK